MGAGRPKLGVVAREISLLPQHWEWLLVQDGAGNLPNFEEAVRFLYRKDKKKFTELIAAWPKDVVKHANQLSNGVFE